MEVTIALDAMGGDRGPAVTVPAAIHILERHPALNLILVGQADVIEQALGPDAAALSRFRIEHASETVAMDERPSTALRSKKDSSMRVALNLVKEGAATACVSAGNTGALMAMSRFVLKMLPGIDRPAICGAMPGLNGESLVLDLGANVDSSSEELFQFAVMGSVLAMAIENKENPSVALLNVGEEEIKGNDRVKQTATLLAASSLNYVGFVEGNDLYKGKVDVIVCDGFVGNVALKASEGVAQMMMYFAKQEYSSSFYSKLAAFVSSPVLNAVRRRMDPRRYNGATLLGLRGIVVKSHGGADELSFGRAIEQAILEVEKAVPERISDHLEALLMQRPVN